LLIVLASAVFLVSDFAGTHDHIFVLSKNFGVLKRGLLFDERRDVTATGHSTLY
jgi:hypothetical protein